MFFDKRGKELEDCAVSGTNSKKLKWIFLGIIIAVCIGIAIIVVS